MKANIPGYDNYSVSRDGVVYNLPDEYPLTPRINNHGYGRVSLRKDGKNKEFLVHRLVAVVFIPNPDDLATVDHIDHDRLNNNVVNLRWLSLSDNLKHRVYAKNT